MILYAKAIYLLLLACKLRLSYEQSNRYNQCQDILEDQELHRFQDRWENTYVPIITCLVCSKKTCDFSENICDRKSIVETIPMYENILEFGLVGESLPLKATVKANMTGNCHVEVRISKQYGNDFILVRVMECLFEILCIPLSYKYRLGLKGIFQCLQVGMIFMEGNIIYFSLSTSCVEVATAAYDKTIFLNLRVCKYQNTTQMEATYFFWQDDSRKYDGILLGLPCTAGGYHIDQHTGRIISGQKCRLHLHYLNLTDPDVGVDFIFSKRFNSQVDLLYPHETGPVSKILTRPRYIAANDTRASRASMKPKIVKNPDYFAKLPFGCDIIEHIIDHETAGLDPREKCEHVISDLRKKPHEILIEEEELNAYLDPDTVCFYCPHRSNGIGIINLPLYHKYLEFGFIGEYFPQNVTVIIFYSIRCELKIQIEHDFEDIIVNFFWCKLHNRDCYRVRPRNNRRLFQPTHVFCTHIALSFHDPERIYYTITFRCWRTIDYTPEKFITRPTDEECGERNNTLWANFRIEPPENSIMEGIPLIIPCSSGGYVISSLSGRYFDPNTCADEYWGALRRKGYVKGIEFVLKLIHNSNQHLLFPKRNQTIPYPRPLYILDNGTALSVEDVKPKVMTDSELQAAEEENCDRIGRQLGDILTTAGVKIAATATVRGFSEMPPVSEGYSVSDLDIQEFVTFIFILQILLKIF